MGETTENQFAWFLHLAEVRSPPPAHAGKTPSLTELFKNDQSPHQITDTQLDKVTLTVAEKAEFRLLGKDVRPDFSKVGSSATRYHILSCQLKRAKLGTLFRASDEAEESMSGHTISSRADVSIKDQKRYLPRTLEPLTAVAASFPSRSLPSNGKTPLKPCSTDPFTFWM